MRRHRSEKARPGWGASVALVLLCCALGGCSVPIADLPVVGLPAGAPTRPAEPAPYPAVHDMPAPRAEPTLDPADQAKIEKDLIRTRDQQEAVAGHPAKDQDQDKSKNKDKQAHSKSRDKAGAQVAKSQDGKSQDKASSD